MKEQKTGIYEIRNIANNKIYIGSSINISNRFIEHRKHLRKGCHINSKLQRAWNKYGEDSFVFSVIHLCPKDLLIRFEQFYIDRHRSVKEGYNIQPKAGNSLDREVKQSTRDKISQSLKGRTLSQEHRKAISHGGKGVKRSLETRLKMSQSFSGRTRTLEHTAKLIASRTGRKLSPEIIENASRGLRKIYLCESPEGIVFLTINIKLFCSQKGIIPQLMCKIARDYVKDIRKKHKQWKCRGLLPSELQAIKPHTDWLHSQAWLLIPKFPDGIWNGSIPKSFVSEQASSTVTTSAFNAAITGVSM